MHDPNIVFVRCGAHTIHLAAKHFLAAIAPTHRHPNRNDSGSEDEEEDEGDTMKGRDLTDNENPLWVPGDLLGKCLAFVTQVGSSAFVPFSLTV